VPDRDALTALWTDTLLPGLGGLTKAMYAVGRFTEVSGTVAVFALPNEVHRQKCDQKRADVERALAEQVGADLTLRLVVDAEGEASGPTGGGRGSAPSRGGPPTPVDDDFDLGDTDVHELDDAPDAPSSGIDALTEAFPGATLENP
jgi:DNA polymerase III subunit gamma/tau